MKIPALQKTYDKRIVLKTPEILLYPGKITVAIGPNGSGKSTFAKILSGIISDDDKQILLKDKIIRYMPQKSYPFRMSIEKNILLSGGDPQKAKELTDRLNLSSLRSQKISSLSGGEAAKIAFIRVILQECDLLILDEPTAAMDMESAMIAETLLKEFLASVNCSVLLITHDLFQARRLADEALFFHDGKLIEQGKASVVLHEPKETLTKRFLDYYGGTEL